MAKVSMIDLDAKKLDAFLKGKNQQEVSVSIGKNFNYMHSLRTRLRMPTATYRLLCRIYDLKEGDLQPDPPEPELPALEVEQLTFIPKTENKPKPKAKRECYWLDLADNGNHVVLRLMYGDDELFRAAAKVKGGEGADELNFIQAISYAAHMLYKFAEQKDLTSE